MHTDDKELIQSKLNEWFKGIRKKLNSEKNLTSTRISEAQEIELDQFIQRKWDDFRETFKCTIHKFSSIERREYIGYLEAEFKKCADKLNAEYSEFYQIKIRPKTQILILPPRKLESTEARSEAAEMHAHVYKMLQSYWQSNFWQEMDNESLWGNLYLSMIYLSGCSNQDVLQILPNTFRDALSNKYLQSFRLYKYENLKDNPIILHLKVKSDSYGNDFEKDQLYKWTNIYLNPWAQFFLQTLLSRRKKHFHIDQNTDIEQCILKSLHHLKQTKYVIKLCMLLRKKGLNTFQHVQMALQFDRELNLDIFLGNILAQNINTVALRPQEHIFLSASHTTNPSIELTDIKIEQEQLKSTQDEPISITKKLKTIPFKIQLFENNHSASTKAKGVSTQRKKNNNFYERYTRIQQELEQKSLQASSEENNLIQAQLRLIAWVFHHRKKGLKISTISKYLSCFGKDFIFEVWFRKIDLECLSEEDYSDLYQQLLWNCRKRDEAEKMKDQNKLSRKGHNSEAYRFGRLKAFHAFCCEKFKAPEVKLLKQTKYRHMQITNARIISPSVFNNMLYHLDFLVNINQSWSKHITPLKLIYILSYRLGLRLNEVRCLTLQDIICPELISLKSHKDEIKNITLCIQNNPYRRLKTPNAHRHLPIKYLLMKNEFEIFKEFLKSRYIQWKNNKEDHLLFNYKDQVLTELCITQVTSNILRAIYGENHGYSFHSLRHSAANTLAILLGGSPRLIHTYTDYSMRQVKYIRELFFGHGAYRQQDMIQQKWKALAAWMGHSSIEQTASNYCHVLEIIAIDRIVNHNYLINKNVISESLSMDSNNDEFHPINDVINAPEFDWMCTRSTVKQDNKRQSALKVEKIKLNPLERIMAVKDGYLEDKQAKMWLHRCNFLSKKWSSTTSFHIEYQNFIHDEDEFYFEEFYDRVKKLKLIDSKDILVAMDNPIPEKLSEVLSVMVAEVKQRKNFLHFQIRQPKHRHPVNDSDTNNIDSKLKKLKDFISGISSILENTISIHVEDLASNPIKKEQIQRISFIRTADKKNITLAVLFHLMIMAVQMDSLW